MISHMVPGKNNVDGYIFRALMAQGKVRKALGYPSHERTGAVLGAVSLLLWTGEFAPQTSIPMMSMLLLLAG